MGIMIGRTIKIPAKKSFTRPHLDPLLKGEDIFKKELGMSIPLHLPLQLV